MISLLSQGQKVCKVRGLEEKFSEKQKKTVTADKGQTISRLSCLTVTVTRIFRQFFGLGLCPTTPAGFFPQSEYIPP